ncbi:unnamed protein product [Paramecium pentaurelia]|uniref:Uncharacterized protein n=1 Tax=Paramecium pentaurelia TaxID=43138 RepID=A0A8S1V4D8_9CILI|nr:unnamed protein product [Paramecium pentaurelia]
MSQSNIILIRMQRSFIEQINMMLLDVYQLIKRKTQSNILLIDLSMSDQVILFSIVNNCFFIIQSKFYQISFGLTFEIIYQNIKQDSREGKIKNKKQNMNTQMIIKYGWNL